MIFFVHVDIVSRVPPFFIGIPFRNRIDLLKAAIESMPSYRREVVVINNSDEIALEGLGVRTVITPPTPLTFAQSMNVFRKMAMEGGLPFYLFAHSDMRASDATIEGLLKQCRHWADRWGCLFTSYDALCAVNTVAAAEVGEWDPNLPQYFADNDYYRRMAMAKYPCTDSGLKVFHEPSQTIKSDFRLNFLNAQTFPLHRRYYEAKWGGPSGQERFTLPFNGALA